MFLNGGFGVGGEEVKKKEKKRKEKKTRDRKKKEKRIDRYFKNPRMSNFMRIRPVADEMFHAAIREVDRRTARQT
jgi:hypothetical protein